MKKTNSALDNFRLYFEDLPPEDYIRQAVNRAKKKAQQRALHTGITAKR